LGNTKGTDLEDLTEQMSARPCNPTRRIQSKSSLIPQKRHPNHTRLRSQSHRIQQQLHFRPHHLHNNTTSSSHCCCHCRCCCRCCHHDHTLLRRNESYCSQQIRKSRHYCHCTSRNPGDYTSTHHPRLRCSTSRLNPTPMMHCPMKIGYLQSSRENIRRNSRWHSHEWDET
jgi:hypothetical protein